MLYNHNETRLLKLRARELSLVLSTAVPTLQTPLASAAELADATGGSAAKFRAFMTPLVGTGRALHVGLAVARRSVPRGPDGRGRHASGAGLEGPAKHATPVRRGRAERTAGADQPAPGAAPRLGYAFAVPGAHGGYVVYAENPLPANRRSQLAESTGFGDLNYALYLGRSRERSDRLVSNMTHFPITGRQASTVVPFGKGAFTLVVTPARSLGGTFFEDLPWLIVLVGGDGVDGGGRDDRADRPAACRRRAAGGVLDRVASENRQLYTQQRGIAQTLQHALLPETFPDAGRGCGPAPATCRPPRGSTWAGTGTTWFPTEDGGALLLIGDVSGHGLRAATTMASLRHAALAYAAEDTARRRCSRSCRTSSTPAPPTTSPPCCASAWTSPGTGSRWPVPDTCRRC